MSRRASATAMIHIEPGKERAVYAALVALPRHNEVEVGYVTKLLHCHICDAMVMLIGERTASLSGYVMSWIRSIPGVTDTEVVSTLDWKVLAEDRRSDRPLPTSRSQYPTVEPGFNLPGYRPARFVRLQHGDNQAQVGQALARE